LKQKIHPNTINQNQSDLLTMTTISLNKKISEILKTNVDNLIQKIEQADVDKKETEIQNINVVKNNIHTKNKFNENTQKKENSFRIELSLREDDVEDNINNVNNINNITNGKKKFDNVSKNIDEDEFIPNLNKKQRRENEYPADTPNVNKIFKNKWKIIMESDTFNEFISTKENIFMRLKSKDSLIVTEDNINIKNEFEIPDKMEEEDDNSDSDIEIPDII
jgi:hypothetical protein